MNQPQTPRTDHEEAIDNGDTKPLLNSMRQLERELNAAKAENTAMREAVKEAYKTLHDIVFNRECGFEIDLKCENTIAKLHPYLK